jgi:hypothetical protein
MDVISFVNQKGGTGKSMLAINLAVTAQAAGEKVCLGNRRPLVRDPNRRNAGRPHP